MLPSTKVGGSFFVSGSNDALSFASKHQSIKASKKKGAVCLLQTDQTTKRQKRGGPDARLKSQMRPEKMSRTEVPYPSIAAPFTCRKARDVVHRKRNPLGIVLNKYNPRESILGCAADCSLITGNYTLMCITSSIPCILAMDSMANCSSLRLCTEKSMVQMAMRSIFSVARDAMVRWSLSVMQSIRSLIR